jgi:hypothetical protein
MERVIKLDETDLSRAVADYLREKGALDGWERVEIVFAYQGHPPAFSAEVKPGRPDRQLAVTLPDNPISP